MELKFRTLRAEEIDCRVATINAKGLSLLLYKDARVDQNILDESVGIMNWQRHHSRDNANCIVSIWDDEKKQWIEKEDTGTESYTEKEKGIASDSFKRACFNWGIGRELYSAPFIWISSKDVDIKERNGKPTTYDKLVVEHIAYDEKKNISELRIKNTRTGLIVYDLEPSKKDSQQKESVGKSKIDDAKIKTISRTFRDRGIPFQKVFNLYKLKSWEEMTVAQFKNAMDNIDRIEEL